MGKSKKNSNFDSQANRGIDQDLADDMITPDAGMTQSGESTNANTATMQARKLQQDQQTTLTDKRSNQPDH